MKKILVVISCILLFGCDNSDEKTNPTLFRKWYFLDITVNGVAYPYLDNEPCGKDYIEFKSPNIVRLVDVFGCEEDEEWVKSFSFENGVLTFFDGATETIPYQVTRLDYDFLIYTYTLDNDNDGVNEEYIVRYSTY